MTSEHVRRGGLGLPPPRRRQLIGPRNPDVVARLFGGRFDAWATFPHQRLAGVPDPAFWLVMEYWRLGDWRHP